jgi:hypothetical protein
MFLKQSNGICAPYYNKEGSEMNSPQVPISWGEFFDKITILQVKLENLTSKNALENVEQELKKLQSIFVQYCPKTMETTKLQGELRNINQQIWDIENNIRDKQRNNSFDHEFIQFARSVHIANDERFRIKRKINDLFRSELIEEKSFAEY